MRHNQKANLSTRLKLWENKEIKFDAYLTVWVVISGCSYGLHAQAGKDLVDQDVERLISQLDAKTYSVRESSMKKLQEIGAKAVIPAIENLQTNASERSYRLLIVLNAINKNIDLDQHDRLVEQLEELEASSDERKSQLASKLLGGKLDPVVGKMLKNLVVKSSMEKKPLSLPRELVEKLVASDAIRVSRRKATRNDYWRKLGDSNAEPTLVAYRIRWFNGSWSQWIVPGINDAHDNAPKKLLWNFFYDHEHESMTIDAKRGEFRMRQDFLKLNCSIKKIK